MDVICVLFIEYVYVHININKTRGLQLLTFSYQINSESSRSGALGASSFASVAAASSLDLFGDEVPAMVSSKRILRWDRKRKRFINAAGAAAKDPKKRLVRTENGVLLPQSFNSTDSYVLH